MLPTVFLLLVTLVFGLFLSGCGKEDNPANPAVSAAQEQTQAAPPQQAPATPTPIQPRIQPVQQQPAAPPPVVNPVVIPKEADASAALSQLTQAYRRFVFEHRRSPKTIEEVMASGYVGKVPPPPPGKKYAINKQDGTVILMNQ